MKFVFSISIIGTNFANMITVSLRHRLDADPNEWKQ